MRDKLLGWSAMLFLAFAIIFGLRSCNEHTTTYIIEVENCSTGKTYIITRSCTYKTGTNMNIGIRNYERSVPELYIGDCHEELNICNYRILSKETTIIEK